MLRPKCCFLWLISSLSFLFWSWLKLFLNGREYFWDAVICPNLSNVVWEKFSFNFPWWKLSQRGIIWSMSHKKIKYKKMPVSRTNMKKNVLRKKTFRKSLWSVFSPMCLIYIYTQCSKSLSVCKSRQSCHWLTNGEWEPDFHTRDQLHQTPLTHFPVYCIADLPPVCYFDRVQWNDTNDTRFTPTHSARMNTNTLSQHTSTERDTNAYICKNLKIV